MERRYPGGYLLAIYIAQQAILALKKNTALKHVVDHEVEEPQFAGDDFLWQEKPIPICQKGPLCFAIQSPPTAVNMIQTADSIGSPLARDVARIIAMYIQKRPAMVHAFYVHYLKQNFLGVQQRGTCEYCHWIVAPQNASACDYCQFGACHLCVPESSYSTCTHGCCRLCRICYQVIMDQNRCEADPNCLQLACGRRLATPCKDRGCKGRFCAEHAVKNGHVCRGAQKRAALDLDVE